MKTAPLSASVIANLPAPATIAAANLNARRRSRAVEITAPDAMPGAELAQQLAASPSELQALAKEYFAENKKMNAAKGKAEKARKALYQKMKLANVAPFGFLATLDDGANVSLEVAITTPEKNIVNLEILRKIVGEAKFMEIVTASQESVTEHAGGATLTQCLQSVPGTENVKVTAAK